jgi:hypothetical protein
MSKTIDRRRILFKVGVREAPTRPRAARAARNPWQGEDHHVFKHYKRYGQASRPISTRKLRAYSALAHRAYQPRSLRGVFRQVILRETSSCGGFHA